MGVSPISCQWITILSFSVYSRKNICMNKLLPLFHDQNHYIVISIIYLLKIHLLSSFSTILSFIITRNFNMIKGEQFMSIFDNIIATFDVATDLVKEVVSDAIQDGAEKILDSVDLAERRAYRKLDKFEDKASAVFGVDKYANSSLAERFNHVFFSGQTERKTKV